MDTLDRAGAVLGDRRVGALRSSRPVLFLARDHPFRARPALSGGSDMIARPAPRTPDGAGRGVLGKTAAGPRSVKRSSAASAGNHHGSSTSPGARSTDSTPLAPARRRPPETQQDRRGRDRPRLAAYCWQIATWTPHATAFPRPPCRRATPHAATTLPPKLARAPREAHHHALEPDTRTQLRLARRPSIRLAHDNSAINRLSTRPPQRPRSTLDSGRTTNKRLRRPPK